MQLLEGQIGRRMEAGLQMYLAAVAVTAGRDAIRAILQ